MPRKRKNSGEGRIGAAIGRPKRDVPTVDEDTVATQIALRPVAVPLPPTGDGDDSLPDDVKALGLVPDAPPSPRKPLQLERRGVEDLMPTISEDLPAFDESMLGSGFPKESDTGGHSPVALATGTEVAEVHQVPDEDLVPDDDSEDDITDHGGTEIQETNMLNTGDLETVSEIEPEEKLPLLVDLALELKDRWKQASDTYYYCYDLAQKQVFRIIGTEAMNDDMQGPVFEAEIVGGISHGSKGMVSVGALRDPQNMVLFHPDHYADEHAPLMAQVNKITRSIGTSIDQVKMKSTSSANLIRFHGVLGQWITEYTSELEGRKETIGARRWQELAAVFEMEKAGVKDLSSLLASPPSLQPNEKSQKFIEDFGRYLALLEEAFRVYDSGTFDISDTGRVRSKEQASGSVDFDVVHNQGRELRDRVANELGISDGVYHSRYAGKTLEVINVLRVLNDDRPRIAALDDVLRANGRNLLEIIRTLFDAAKALQQVGGRAPVPAEEPTPGEPTPEPKPAPNLTPEQKLETQWQAFLDRWPKAKDGNRYLVKRGEKEVIVRLMLPSDIMYRPIETNKVQLMNADLGSQVPPFLFTPEKKTLLALDGYDLYDPAAVNVAFDPLLFQLQKYFKDMETNPKSGHTSDAKGPILESINRLSLTTEARGYQSLLHFLRMNAVNPAELFFQLDQRRQIADKIIGDISMYRESMQDVDCMQAMRLLDSVNTIQDAHHSTESYKEVVEDIKKAWKRIVKNTQMKPEVKDFIIGLLQDAAFIYRYHRMVDQSAPLTELHTVLQQLRDVMVEHVQKKDAEIINDVRRTVFSPALSTPDSIAEAKDSDDSSDEFVPFFPEELSRKWASEKKDDSSLSGAQFNTLRRAVSDDAPPISGKEVRTYHSEPRVRWPAWAPTSPHEDSSSHDSLLTQAELDDLRKAMDMPRQDFEAHDDEQINDKPLPPVTRRPTRRDRRVQQRDREQRVVGEPSWTKALQEQRVLDNGSTRVVVVGVKKDVVSVFAQHMADGTKGYMTFTRPKMIHWLEEEGFTPDSMVE